MAVIDPPQLKRRMCHQCVTWLPYGDGLFLFHCGAPQAWSMNPVRRWITHPALALAATLLAGVFEAVALARSRGAARWRPPALKGTRR